MATTEDLWAASTPVAFESSGGDWGVPSMHKPANYNPDESEGFGAGGFGDDGGSREMGTCFNCGESGHSKADCPNPRVFTGACRHCNQEGHMAKDCPDKPAQMCRNCGEEGHVGQNCPNARKLDHTGTVDLAADDAWAKMIDAAKEKDLEDFREGMKSYTKAVPEVTYRQIEEALRMDQSNVFLIAFKQDVGPKETLVNLQGKQGCEYVLKLSFAEKPRRQVDQEGWPESPEQNLERLEDCGVIMESLVPFCRNCDQSGHTTKSCPEKKREIERVEIKCYNCGALGHRVRDCPTPRLDPNACRNCKQPGHTAAECTEERDMSGVECKRCNEMGHFAKDCPQKPPSGCRNCGEEGHMKAECTNPPNPALMTCRNCEQKGHMSRDCPLPRNMANVTCNNCGENGHFSRGCPNPKADEADSGGFGASSATNNQDGGTGGWGGSGSNAAVVIDQDMGGW